MRRAFTMIELLTVMSIMAMLGVAASGGYAALQRGMRERAAVAAASALLKSAKERAAVDRVPTAVFCYNRLLKDANAAQDENGVVVGVMTAVRRSGRISYLRGKFLYDEFGDLDLTYEALSDDEKYSTDGATHSANELEDRPGRRLWRFPTSEEMKYSIVSDAVWSDASMTETIFSGGTSEQATNILMTAFYNLGGSKREPSWKVGDPYAFEIGEIQMPRGFIFGSKIPNDVATVELVEVFLFDPDDENNESIDVWSTKPNASGVPAKFKKAGVATSDEQKTM